MMSNFVHQWEKVLNERYFNDKENNVRKNYTWVIFKTCYKIEKDVERKIVQINQMPQRE